MIKVDALIEKFKELKEELNKGVNMSYSPGTQSPMGVKTAPSMGTSGGQGGMYRSEDVEKNVAPMSASPGGASEMTMVKFDKNGQWKMEKADKGHSSFTMDHVRQVSAMKDHGAAKQLAHAAVDSSTANSANKMKMKRMIDMSKSPSHLAQGMSNHILAHPSEGLKVAKVDPEENINIEHPQGKATQADGVNKGPGKWKKSADLADGVIEVLQKGIGYVSEDGKNREANPKLKQHDIGPGGKVHIIKKDEGTNEEAASSKPHNKGKFKVMDEVKEKEEKHASPSGLPYSGKDKDVRKGEDCPKCKHDPCTCVEKSKIGHIQGNEAKGFDENKAPGREVFSV